MVFLHGGFMKESQASTLLTGVPNSFVSLKEADPTLLIVPRYTTPENFVDRPIRGYRQPRLLLTKAAAKALSLAQKEFLSDGFSLVVYDAYRPQRAVNHFIEWASDLRDQKMKAIYYPRADKENLFALGYIAEKSGHSRGSTVDLTLISRDASLLPSEKIVRKRRYLKDNFEMIYLEDGTLDMGTSFDFMDLASHHDSPLVEKAAQDMRNYLRATMQKHGFKAYPKEWWHYTLENEPFPDTYFDFEI